METADIYRSKDIIGIVQTQHKDVWRVSAALAETFRELIAIRHIFPPVVVGGGFPESSEGEKKREATNESAVDSNRYIRPSKAVTELTPTFQVIPNPKVIITTLTVPIVKDIKGDCLVTLRLNIFFECDTDFSEKIEGQKLILTWEPVNPKIDGIIEQNSHGMVQPMTGICQKLASKLDGIGYLSTDSGILAVRTTSQY